MIAQVRGVMYNDCKSIVAMYIAVGFEFIWVDART